MKTQLWLGLLLALAVGFVGQAAPTLAQSKTLVWERYDVNLEVLPNSDILVEEIQEIAFTSGTFRFGFAAIPLDRVETISDVSVSEIINGAERPYTPNSTGEYGFTTAVNDSNELEITWYFRPTSNSTHTYILRYRVEGGLRIYEGGDQIWWKAIPADHNFPINSATVTVTLPQTFSKSELVVDAYGAPIDNASYTDRGQVVFTAGHIPPGEELEVRVQFPHGVVQGSPPAWQSSDDVRREWGPVMGVLFGALGLFLLFGGPLAVFFLWYTRGRDAPVPATAEYVTEPPSDLPAAIVGTLVDEHADMKDIIAGILDLAQRGAIRMEEQKKDAFMGFGVSREFIFHLEDESKAVYPHEKRLLERIFGKKMRKERKLRDLNKKFYTAIPDLKSMLYKEMVSKGYFTASPESTRQKYTWLGVLGAIVAFGFSFCLLVLLGDFSAAVACPALSLLASMVALIFVGRHMPRKTPAGAEEAARWLAFKRYLENIEKHGDLDSVKEKFEEYLPYAMAFGLERRLIHKFSKIDTPAPTWWGPRPYYYGPYMGGMGRASSSSSEPMTGPPGPLAGEGGGMGSLSDMSSGLGDSLAGMSDGLGSLLSSASSTFTSQPSRSSSSGGWGGGGFSGGGSFGGGGGGGGSRGFG